MYTGGRSEAAQISRRLARGNSGVPEVAKQQAGHQLELVQCGEEPADWKPMPAVGPGIREIRVKDERGIFRVFYVAKFLEAVYVLHCFQKKTQQTSGKELEKERES